MAKYKVRVTLVAECEVDIEVECDEGLDPSDLTPEEERSAIALADFRPRWSVEKAKVVS